jgi:hypothetical protein
MLRGLALLPRRSILSPAPAVSSCNLSPLRAFGAEDEKSPRTPSAWMRLLDPPVAPRQIVFLVWVSLSERKWVILAERRGPIPPVGFPIHFFEGVLG